MKISSTSINLTKVAEKINLSTIEHAISQLDFPLSLSDYEELCIAVIVRGDSVYPEEHYRIGNTLYLALQFDPEQVSTLTPEEVTNMVCEKTKTYLSNISEVEEREFQMMRY